MSVTRGKCRRGDLSSLRASSPSYRLKRRGWRAEGAATVADRQRTPRLYLVAGVTAKKQYLGIG
jgi:hypothetical protein